MNLMNASKEWMKRPADERFTTLSELKESVSVRKHISYEGNINTNELKVIPKDDDIVVNYDGQNLNMTNWSFGQLSSLAGAPASIFKKITCRPGIYKFKPLTAEKQNRSQSVTLS